MKRTLRAVLAGPIAVAVAVAGATVEQPPQPCDNLPDTLPPCRDSGPARPETPLVLDASGAPSGSRIDADGQRGASPGADTAPARTGASQDALPSAQPSQARIARRISWRQLQ